MQAYKWLSCKHLLVCRSPIKKARDGETENTIGTNCIYKNKIGIIISLCTVLDRLIASQIVHPVICRN
jgi:hypothetical protein